VRFRLGYQAGQLIELVLGDAAHGGWCVARPDGQPVVFVRHGLPGERVRAQVTDVTAKFARADAVEVLDASPDRVQPPCPYARPDGCGGCDWQHASLPAQRALKAFVVAQQLRRLAGVDLAVAVEALPEPGVAWSGGPGVAWSGEIDMPAVETNGLGWRTRVQFAVRGDGVAGLRAHRSHRVVDVGECLIAHPAISSLRLTKQHWPAATVETVEAVVAPGSGERAVIVTGEPADLDVAAIAGDAVLARPRRRGSGPPGGLYGLRGRAYLTERAAGRDWRVSAGGFWQVHPAAADALSAAVLAALSPCAGDTVLDLYCGAGLFGGVLGATGGVNVIGIESDAAAVRDARHNLPAAARIHRGDVAALLRRGGLPPARLVVADPPRTGLAREVIDYITDPEHGAERFAYVSCDPATLARDVGLLMSRGWTLAGLRAFDAFPMTHHVECVATLLRSLRVRLLLERLGTWSAGDVIAQTRYPGQQPFVFEHAQGLGAGLPCVAVLLAERGDGRRRVARREDSLGDIPAEPRGEANVRSWVRFVTYRHPRTILDRQ
jgi:tRNA/tmRNA/rRNA uracil-C5-methylase (TrmA/RlmC/RlmD family)